MSSSVGGIQWSVPPLKIHNDLSRMRGNIKKGLENRAKFWSATLESRAKKNAPWTDRTSKARAGLRGFYDISNDRWAIYLVHSVDYGLYLELGTQNMSPYAIIMPTFDEAIPEIMPQLKTLLED